MSNLRWKIAQAAEIRWWQGYLGKRPTASYLEWKKNYWQQMLVKAAIELKAGQRVMDAGCGPAGMFMILDQCEVVAVDPLLTAYERKLDHFDPKVYPWAQFYPSPLESFETKQSFDHIFCLNAINHVANLDACLDKLCSWLAPGGQLHLSIDAHNHQAFKKIFSWIPGDILHPHQYDLAEYQNMMTQRGLELTDTLLFDEAFFFNYYLLKLLKT